MALHSSTQEIDYVNAPPHYTNCRVECIDYIEMTSTPEEYVGFLIGNVKKYVHRYKDKNGVEDLEKARFYLNKAIGVIYAQSM